MVKHFTEVPRRSEIGIDAVSYRPDFLFSTPIIRRRIENAESLNERLARTIQQHADHSPSSDRTNVRGWHGSDNIFSWGSEELLAVESLALEAIRIAHQTMIGEKSDDSIWELYGWANVMGATDYHRRHCHPGSTWSGVYFVCSDLSDERPDSGLLVLEDPRPGASASNCVGYAWGGGVPILPLPGTMIVFPGWLMHSTNPHSGSTARISIAFNSRCRPMVGAV